MDLNELLHRQQIARSRAATAQDSETRMAQDALAARLEQEITERTGGRLLFVGNDVVANADTPGGVGQSVGSKDRGDRQICRVRVAS